MKTAISLPDPLFKSAERAARKLRMSRSRFFATAASHFIRETRKYNVTERLNAVYGEKGQNDSRVPSSITEIQMAAIRKERW
jgi:metal-responsive CopG/Arc/MetJ family transcriptional regulator